MRRYWLKKVMDQKRNELQSRYEECQSCEHRGSLHAMNCLECCPVERKMKQQAAKTPTIKEIPCPTKQQ